MSIIDKARELVDGERQEQYGDPGTHFALVARLWSGRLGMPISPAMVTELLMLLKAARMAVPQPKYDSLLDLVGYCELTDRLREAEPEVAKQGAGVGLPVSPVKSEGWMARDKKGFWRWFEGKPAWAANSFWVYYKDYSRYEVPDFNLNIEPPDSLHRVVEIDGEFYLVKESEESSND